MEEGQTCFSFRFAVARPRCAKLKLLGFIDMTSCETLSSEQQQEGRETHLEEAEELRHGQKAYWYLVCIFHYLKKGEETRTRDCKLLIPSELV